MTLSGFVLVLAAAFCHAIWNFFVKRIHGGPELIWLFSVIAVLIYAPIAITIFVVDKPTFGLWELLFFAGNMVLHLGYFLLLQAGYRKGDLSIVYPTARATGPFLSTTFAVLILGETMTIQIAIGAVTVIVGVICLMGGFRGVTKHRTRSLYFGLGAGLLIGSYTVWDAHAVSALMIPPLLLDFGSSVARVVLLTPIAVKRFGAVRGYWRDHRTGVIVIAIFSPLAYILVLYALAFTPVVYVAPTREISVLLTVVMGSILLGEGELKKRLTWAVVILIGVVLLATA